MTLAAATVFVVDDDPSVREAVGGLLRFVGHGPRLFGSAQEFLAGAKPEGPASVVLDVRMPGLGGLDCQQRLSDAGFPIPVIFMSGHGDIPMTVRVMKAGALDFLTKPPRTGSGRRGESGDRAGPGQTRPGAGWRSPALTLRGVDRQGAGGDGVGRRRTPQQADRRRDRDQRDHREGATEQRHASGAVCFLTKPFNEDDVERLRSALTNRG